MKLQPKSYISRTQQRRVSQLEHAIALPAPRSSLGPRRAAQRKQRCQRKATRRAPIGSGMPRRSSRRASIARPSGKRCARSTSGSTACSPIARSNSCSSAQQVEYRDAHGARLERSQQQRRRRPDQRRSRRARPANRRHRHARRACRRRAADRAGSRPRFASPTRSTISSLPEIEPRRCGRWNPYGADLDRACPPRARRSLGYAAPGRRFR